MAPLCSCSLATLLLTGVAALLLLPSLVLLLEVLAALPRRRARGAASASPPRMAVLVPAHDEETCIGQGARALRGELGPADRLLVVADNCQDRTAAIAREAGAEVIERQSASERGKGFAISFGLAALRPDPPEVVVIVDADCWVVGGSLARLAEAARSTGRAVQADYLITAPAAGAKLGSINAFAVLVRNRVRPLGLDRLAKVCQLTGSGMAFPWKVIVDAPAMKENLVEDLALGMEMTLAGQPPRLCPDVRVQSELPDGAQAGLGQRRRWEHGQLYAMATYAPRLVSSFLRRPRAALLGLALDLLVPPLSLLVTMQLAFFALAGAGTVLHISSSLPVLVSELSLGAVFLATGLAWLFFGRSTLPLGTVLRIPFYVLWKASLYTSLLVKGKQKTWERTERNPEASQPKQR